MSSKKTKKTAGDQVEKPQVEKQPEPELELEPAETEAEAMEDAEAERELEELKARAEKIVARKAKVCPKHNIPIPKPADSGMLARCPKCS